MFQCLGWFLFFILVMLVSRVALLITKSVHTGESSPETKRSPDLPLDGQQREIAWFWWTCTWQVIAFILNTWGQYNKTNHLCGVCLSSLVHINIHFLFQCVHYSCFTFKWVSSTLLQCPQISCIIVCPGLMCSEPRLKKSRKEEETRAQA